MLVVEKGPANVFGLLGVDKNERNYHGTIVRAQSTCLQRGVLPGGCHSPRVVYAQRDAWATRIQQVCRGRGQLHGAERNSRCKARNYQNATIIWPGRGRNMFCYSIQ